MHTWHEVEARLELECPMGEGRRPVEADIDDFETAAGFRLPDDYRRFALSYGPGSLIGTREFEIYVPGLPEGRYTELSRHNPPGGVPVHLSCYSDEAIAGTLGLDPARAKRMVFFCHVRDDDNGFAWDPGEVTDPTSHEMAIYRFGNPSVESAWRVALTFLEFLVDYALKGRYARDYDRERRPEEPDGHDTWGEGRSIRYIQMA